MPRSQVSSIRNANGKWLLLTRPNWRHLKLHLFPHYWSPFKTMHLLLGLCSGRGMDFGEYPSFLHSGTSLTRQRLISVCLTHKAQPRSQHFTVIWYNLKPFRFWLSNQNRSISLIPILLIFVTISNHLCWLQNNGCDLLKASNFISVVDISFLS